AGWSVVVKLEAVYPMVVGLHAAMVGVEGRRHREGRLGCARGVALCFSLVLQSCRSAAIGSIVDARYAGSNPAAADTARNAIEAIAIVSGSFAASPCNIDRTNRPLASVHGMPIVRPAIPSHSPSLAIACRTARGVAPRAMRMPISRVRLATE